MKNGGGSKHFWRVGLIALILSGCASVAGASPLLSCNNGTNTTCTFWVDIFSGTVSETPINASSATTENSNFNGTIAIPQWDTAGPTSNTELVLTGVQFVLNWAATGSVSVTNDDTASHSFTNAY